MDIKSSKNFVFIQIILKISILGLNDWDKKVQITEKLLFYTLLIDF